MPPRGRSRKRRPGSSRSDAAMEHMRLMGFDKDVVKATINELLEVYGDEGWVFIEEDSYRVLVEAILEKERQKMELTTQNGDSSRNGHWSPGGNDSDALAASSLSVVAACSAMEGPVPGEDNTHALAAKSSSAAHACSSVEVALTQDRDLDAACQSDIPPQPINELEAIYPLLPPEGESSGSEDMDLDEDIEQQNQPDFAKENDVVDGPNSMRLSAPEAALPLEQANPLPIQRPRRRPCYGWIDSDDESEPDIAKGNDDNDGPRSMHLSPPEPGLPLKQANPLPTPRPRHRSCYGWINSDEEVDLVELEPAPVPEVFSSLIGVADAIKKSRWDMGPNKL